MNIVAKKSIAGGFSQRILRKSIVPKKYCKNMDTMRIESAIKATSGSLIITLGVWKREEKVLAIQHARKPTRSR